MALTISRPVQIFALVAIVAAVGGVGMLALKPKHAATPPVVVTKAPVKPATMAPTHRATTTPSVTAKPAVAPKPATTAPKPPVSPVGTNGLPNALNAAFRKHRIVVVSLFDPQSSTDAISYAEARAGTAPPPAHSPPPFPAAGCCRSPASSSTARPGRSWSGSTASPTVTSSRRRRQRR
ncbi:MAG: hypothetical protein E6F98_00055 [Actinobacteria bacterium]|nr:MAG: hypothetical protein E6F98_00055 [Actinomycetota bacterium]